MPRSLARRCAAIVSALWMVVVLAEPAALHACPMHDGVHGRTHQHAGVPAVHHADHSAPRAPGTKALSCSCVGACCAAVAVAWPPSPAVLAVLVVQQRPERLDSSAIDFRPSAAEYARPPTIGPPVHTA